MGLPDSPRLLDRVRDKIRVKHYSIRTEQPYVDWIRRFILFHGKRHPDDLGAIHVEAFLTDLAVVRRVASSTQNQAKSALLFLYKDVLGTDLPWLTGIETAKAAMRLPVVLTRDEVKQLLAELRAVHALIGRFLYGTGMRIMEGIRLRVKDVDFSRREIAIRDGKGLKDRVTVLPTSIMSSLSEQLKHARRLHCGDLVLGFGAVWLPHALARKYPNASREWAWQYVSPAGSVHATNAPESFAGIIFPSRRSSGRSNKPCATPVSPSLPHRIRCDTMPPRKLCRVRRCSRRLAGV